MKKTLITTILFCAALLSIRAQTIPSNFFGMNYWMPYQFINSSTGIPGGFVNYPNIQRLVTETDANFFRIGGNGYDEKGTAIGTSINFNDYITAIQKVKDVTPMQNF
jgi:hypothetical protein